MKKPQLTMYACSLGKFIENMPEAKELAAKFVKAQHAPLTALHGSPAPCCPSPQMIEGYTLWDAMSHVQEAMIEAHWPLVRYALDCYAHGRDAALRASLVEAGYESKINAIEAYLCQKSV
jgi:hypothetical protein